MTAEATSLFLSIRQTELGRNIHYRWWDFVRRLGTFECRV
jgi:hypothetical protein